MGRIRELAGLGGCVWWMKVGVGGGECGGVGELGWGGRDLNLGAISQRGHMGRWERGVRGVRGGGVTLKTLNWG